MSDQSRARLYRAHVDHDQRRGLEAAVVAYVMWGLLTLYWKQLADFDPVELVGWRISTAALVMTAVLLLTGRFANLRLLLDRETLASVVAASLLLTVNWSTYVWAVSNDHVIDTALGYFLAPLGTMAIGVFVLGERLTPLKRASIACAIAAVIVLVVSYGAMPWVALLLAVSWTSYGFVKRRVALDPVTSLTGELLVLVVPAVAIVDRPLRQCGWRAERGVARRAAARARHRHHHRDAAAAVRVRRQARAVHDPRSRQLSDSRHQLPARLADLRRSAATESGWSVSCSCGAR